MDEDSDARDEYNNRNEGLKDTGRRGRRHSGESWLELDTNFFRKMKLTAFFSSMARSKTWPRLGLCVSSFLARGRVLVVSVVLAPSVMLLVHLS